MSQKALLVGFKDCEQTEEAYSFLKICGFDATPVYTEPRRGARLPMFVKDWSGEYLFHLKSYCILRKRLLDRVSIAAVNFHPCPPKYPGAGGVNRSLYNNDDSSGVTVHYMNEKVDNGKIIKVYRLPIFQNDNIASLMKRIKNKQTEAFYDVVANVAETGQDFLLKESRLSLNESWGNHVGRMKEIDELELTDVNISKKDLEKLIRATHIGKFGPKISLHGYTFQYKESK